MFVIAGVLQWPQIMSVPSGPGSWARTTLSNSAVADINPTIIFLCIGLSGGELTMYDPAAISASFFSDFIGYLWQLRTDVNKSNARVRCARVIGYLLNWDRDEGFDLITDD